MLSTVVLFGATGYLGTLILAEILRSTPWRIIVPVRSGHDLPGVVERVLTFCAQFEGRAGPDYGRRIFPFAMPPPGEPIRLPAALRTASIEKVINAAGSVHYFAEAELDAGNLDMTGRTLEFARGLGTPDYVYVSSAFSAGYRGAPIAEVLHDEPRADPTYYTKTKRMAERMVAASGLPYIIVRPSVLIGHSATGVYTGKPYGLYQFLKSFTYFLTDRYYPVMHVVAPENPFHLLHQDAFALLFLHVLRALPPNRIVNMVSCEKDLPTAGNLYAYFFTRVTRPERVFVYDRMEDVPLDEIPRRQRMFLHITRVNAQITAHPWAFERSTVAALERSGAGALPTTRTSTERCVDRYIQDSVKCQRYQQRYASLLARQCEFVRVPAQNDRPEPETRETEQPTAPRVLP